MRARAIETQCYVIAAAQAGYLNPQRYAFGHTMIVDPWGKILAEVKEDKPGLAIADIDLSYLEKVRQEMPLTQHARTDIYGQ